MVLQTTRVSRHFKLLIERLLGALHAPTPPHTHTPFPPWFTRMELKERERERRIKEKKTFVLLESLKALQQKPRFSCPCGSARAKSRNRPCTRKRQE